MRQVYSSSRLENVERVADLLDQAGIETYLSDGRSYKGNRRRHFSFRDGQQTQPAVWIVKAEDLSRANEIMREMGLGRSTRDQNFVVLAGRVNAPDAKPGRSKVSRIRTTLLIILTLLAGLTSWRMVRGETLSHPGLDVVEACNLSKMPAP